MSVVNGKRVIGASLVLIFIWLIPAVAQASVTSVAISAPVSITAGTSSPICVLAQNGGAPVAGASVSVSLVGPGSVTPATAVTNGSGYASFTLNALTVTGVLTITASSGVATATANVPVVAAPPARLDILSPTGLLPADGYCTYQLIARVQDRYSNGCAGWPVNITVDGTAYVATADSSGNASFIVGPTFNKHTYTVVADANGHSGSILVRFLAVNLYLLSYPSSVPAGQSVSITALLLDDLTPAPGILLTFDVYSPGNLASPSSFAGYTDTNGKVTFTFTTSPTAGMNTVIIGNQSLGGDLRYASVRGTGGQVSQIILATNPSSVPADGSTNCLLQIWAKDSGGNPVKNEDLTVVRDSDENYTVTTNSNGFAELSIGSSTYTGAETFDVYDDNGVHSSIQACYVAGPPSMTVLKAVPNVIASSDVPQPQGMTDVHSTQLIAQVTDQWYHPLPGYSITVTSLNTTAGTITGNASGITDSNGEFYTQFTLGTKSNGTGTVSVRAVSGSLASQPYQITYTNNSFLSVNSTLSPQNVSVNGTINVDISIAGLGWNNRPQPVDMLLITDNSGSMDWYSTVVDSKSTTLPTAGKTYLIATYNNTKYSSLQFMFSSPYTNYANGSYYGSLIVKPPTGSNITGTNSQNENYVQITSGAQLGTYKIYGKFTYSASGGTPPYSYSVCTLPKRLGSYQDANTAAKTAATQLANNMTYLDQMGLVAFNTSGYLCAQLKIVNGTNKTTLLGRINNMNANDGTSLYTGIQKAETEFSTHGRAGIKRVAILLTDGYSQTPAQDIVEAYNAKNAGITIFTIGIGMADVTALANIANITGGQSYTASSDLELSDRYQQIFKNVSEVVANTSTMSIASSRTTLNGTTVNDTQYIPNSAWVTFVNGSRAQMEPIITCDSNNYSLTWNPGAININQIWGVKYQLKAMHGGPIRPISNNSLVTFTKSDGSTGVVNFDSSTLFCQDSINGNVTNPSPGLQLRILSPVNGTITDQLRLSASWQVIYTGNDTYTQRVSILPVEEDKWMDVARGFEGDRNSPGAYSFWWNLERVPTGNYTVQVFVTDGTYDAQDQVTISIPYRSGQIVLQ